MAVSLFPTHSSSTLLIQHHQLLPLQHKPPPIQPNQTQFPKPNNKFLTLSCLYSNTTSPTFPTYSSSDSGSESDPFLSSTTTPSSFSSSNGGITPPVLKKRKRYRKEYPGESQGITEEMRFVAMKLRNDKGSKFSRHDDDVSKTSEGTWEPTMDGFVKYLVDSKLVFETLERIVENSNDVSYAYFRKTGLERSENLTRDLEWFVQLGIAIPAPSNPGVSYATYLKELAEKSAPLFLSHFYIVYFSHITGGQVIAKQVAEKLLVGRELEFYRWEGDAEQLLKDVRETLNRLSEHWSRDDKNKSLKEATKSFKYLGQIVRLIIL